jgi:hypothetical protein
LCFDHTSEDDDFCVCNQLKNEHKEIINTKWTLKNNTETEKGKNHGQLSNGALV